MEKAPLGQRRTTGPTSPKPRADGPSGSTGPLNPKRYRTLIVTQVVTLKGTLIVTQVVTLEGTFKGFLGA